MKQKLIIKLNANNFSILQYLIPLNFRAPLIFAHQGRAKIKGGKFAHQGCAKIRGARMIFLGARKSKGARKLKGVLFFANFQYA